MKIRHIFAGVVAILLFANFSLALAIDAPLSSPELEEKSRNIFREIRCVVCAGETIADSNAEVARDMRANIRELVAQGVSDEQIKADLTAKYGDKILMTPPLKKNTILLWASPWIILLLGAVSVGFYFRGKKL